MQQVRSRASGRRTRGSTLRHGRRPGHGQPRADRRAGAATWRSRPRTCWARSGPSPVGTGPWRSSAATRGPRGEFLAAAVVAGLASAGRRRRRRRGAADPGRRLPDRATPAPTSASMLSASHNPMPDNGIKFFARGGHKLPDEVEDEIEQPSCGETLGAPDRRRRRPGPHASPTPPTGTSRTCSRPLPHRLDGLQGRRRLRARRGRAAAPRGAAREAGAEVDRDRRRAGRPQHQRRLRLDPPRTGCGGGRRARRRRRHRPRRRRRPLPGGRRRRRRRRRRPDHGDPRARHARARRAARGHRRSRP